MVWVYMYTTTEVYLDREITIFIVFTFFHRSYFSTNLKKKKKILSLMMQFQFFFFQEN